MLKVLHLTTRWCGGRLNQAQQRVTDTENRKRQKLNEIQK